MRIAYILPSLACTGPIIVASNLINQLITRAEKIDLYYFNNRNEIDFECETFRIDPLTNIPYDSYDIIHAHMLQPDRYLWKHRKKMKGKTISTVHQFISYSLRTDRSILASQFFSPFWYKYLSVADHVVYISNSLMKESAKHISAKNSSCIYNGIDLTGSDDIIPLSDLEQINQLKHKYKLIGNFANFTVRKGVDQLISCLVQNSELALLLIGDGKELNDLKKQAATLHVTDRCLFMGFRREVKPYYKLLDAYAMTSRSEAFGLSMVEAAALGVPVVCSDIPTFRELFDDTEISFFKPENISSLNLTIIDSLKGDATKISKSFQKYQHNYTAEKMAEGYWKLYEELLLK
jgi:L-malate glycosyltransferase